MAAQRRLGRGNLRPLVGAALVNLCLGSLFAWSLLVAPLKATFGGSEAALSGVFSLAVATFAIVVLTGGSLVDRTPPGRIVAVAAASALVGMLVAAGARSLLWVAVGYGVLFGIGNGLGYATAVAVPGRAFRERRGLAMGVVVGAYAAGPLVASPVISALLTVVGWRGTFVALGVGIGGLLVGAATLLGRGSFAPTDDDAHAAQHGRHLRLLGRPGGLIGAAFLLGTLPALMVVAHAAAMAGARGLDVGATTAAVALIGAGNLAGRTGGGWLSDRVGRVPGLVVAAALLALACVLLPAVAGVVPILLALLAVGIGYGAQASLVPSLTADVYGARHFAANFGKVFMGWGVAGLLGPQLGARLAGTDGGFGVPLRVGAASAALALLLYALIARSSQHGATDTSATSRAYRGCDALLTDNAARWRVWPLGPPPTTEEQIVSQDTFYDVLDSIDTCMLMTFTGDETPHARPMAIAQRDGSTVWFVTGRDTPKIDELSSGRTAVITAQDSKRWLAATGTASTSDDQQRIEHLWSEPMKAWFPEGTQDSDLVALRVDLDDGEYWDLAGGRMLRFGLGVANSVATGSEIDEDEQGDHGRVDL